MMNKYCYRLVFNRARGLMMAVAENIPARNTSLVTPSGTTQPIHRITLAGILALRLALMLMLGSAIIMHGTVWADIVADSSAPASQQPIIGSTANGLPLVNIQTPSAAGVSRNTYSQFDVNTQGAILNNSNANVQTQLGGWVQGNPYLANGTARVILNEVNSSNPSLLNGFVEIAGSRAQLVIANPAGISCNGCGFINANRATLTTGTPIVNGGNLLGYRVGGGSISFLGSGMDASHADYTDVITRAVELNAGIWAKQLNITTGANQVDIDSNGNQTAISQIATASTSPAFAVDVAALGGMYAGKIHLVGTEAGLGVRNAGHIGASAGEVVVTTDGHIINSGTLAAHTDINITTNHDLQNAGTINANARLSLNAENIDNQDSGDISSSSTTLLSQDTLINRGTIDGNTTHINAGRLDNIGRGSIFGDHLSIQAMEINNVAETVNSTTTAAIMAGRTRLNLATGSLLNRDNAMLFSGGDIAIGGTLDASGIAVGNATSVINEDATIEALGNMVISADEVQNLNTGLQVGRTPETLASYDKFTPRDQGVVWDSADYPGAHIGNVHVEWRSAGPYTFREYTRYQGTSYTSHTEVLSSTPGRILSSGDMQITGNVLNSDSQIVAGAALDISGATVQNLNSEGQTIVRHSGGAWYYDWDGNDDDYDIDYLGNHSPGNIVTTYNLATTRLEGNAASPASGTVVSSNPSTINNNALFQALPDASAVYLIETNPRFTNYRTWLSSDYMVKQLSFDPAITQKRLGDGFYEQRLVREQVAELTGRRFLDGYASDEAQYQALMNAGLTVASQIQLIPGIALSAEQIAQLTSDIVWLVEQEITLPDGTVTKALVPQVYVRLQDGDLSPTTGIMAGKSINISASENITNGGTMAGRTLAVLNADNIQNLGGNISADVTALKATGNIDNIGGTIMARNALVLEAGNNINIESTTQSHAQTIGASSFSRTNLDRVAGLYVSNPDAVLVASAGNDINLMAASIANSGSDGQTVLSAGRDINLGTVQIAEQNNSVRNANNRVSYGSTQDIGTAIQAAGDITLQAGNDANLRAANINSQHGELSIMAAKDINITASKATSNFDQARKTKRSSGLSSTTKTYRNTFEDSQAIGSTLSANTIALRAGTAANETAAAIAGNIHIEGSQVVSDNGTLLQASGDITLAATENTSYTFNQKTTKKSGFSASGSSIGYGTSNLSQKQTGTTITQTGSTVGSIEGNVTIQAGNTYTQTGSDVLTPQGDIDITAQQVNITAANNTSTQTTETKFKQSGLTLAITSPVISAIQTAEQMKQAASNTSDGRMQALAAGTAALAAKNAYDSTQQALSMAATGNGVIDAANQAGGVNLSLSIGTSKSSSTSTQTSSTAQGSTVMAGGNIDIRATGAGEQSDINIIGSTIKADGDVSLKADDEVNLIAAQNTETLNSKNKNSNASVGISIGSNGLAVTASASQGKGKANGTDVTWTESVVQAGNTVSLDSGTDANIIGAQVRGNQVVADVGTSGQGNLNIQSLQDISTYDSKQSSSGISVSVPVGAGMAGGSFSSSNTKIKSDYASVNEQAGIYAGDGGFQVNVNGNTDLKGAVIASSEQAIQDNKNTLTTETLTVSDIQNKAEYDAKASSANIGGGIQAGLPQLSGAGNGSDSDKADSTTVSAISGGTVDITDDAEQQAKSGTNAVTTVALLNRDVHINEQGEAVDSTGNNTANTIAPIFDQEKVQKDIEAQMRITQAFNQEAPRALATYATSKTQPYQDAKDYELIKNRAENNISLTEYELNRLAALEASGMTLESAQTILNDPQAKSDYENWNGNGNYRRAANIIIAAIGGGSAELTSAITKESLSWAADVMRQKMIEDSKKFKGLCDAQGNCINNVSGNSVGVNGDNYKIAGGRTVLAYLCGEGRCTTDSSTQSGYLEDDNGKVKLNITLNELESIPIYSEIRSPLGGHQFSQGQMELLGISFDYIAGSFWDKLAESYAGTHDMLNSLIWYDNLGNGKDLSGKMIGKIGEITNMLNVPLATPFALSTILPPEIWNIIFTSKNLK